MLVYRSVGYFIMFAFTPGWWKSPGLFIMMLYHNINHMSSFRDRFYWIRLVDLWFARCMSQKGGRFMTISWPFFVYHIKPHDTPPHPQSQRLTWIVFFLKWRMIFVVWLKIWRKFMYMWYVYSLDQCSKACLPGRKAMATPNTWLSWLLYLLFFPWYQGPGHFVNVSVNWKNVPIYYIGLSFAKVWRKFC